MPFIYCIQHISLMTFPLGATPAPVNMLLYMLFQICYGAHKADQTTIAH